MGYGDLMNTYETSGVHLGYRRPRRRFTGLLTVQLPLAGARDPGPWGDPGPPREGDPIARDEAW